MKRRVLKKQRSRRYRYWERTIFVKIIGNHQRWTDDAAVRNMWEDFIKTEAAKRTAEFLEEP